MFFALAAGVLWLALTPQPPHAADTGWDKLNHVLAFAALAVAGRFALGPLPRPGRWVWLALLPYGMAIELLQTLVPARSAEWSDVLADAVGIAVGLLLAAVAAGRRRRRGAPLT
ncbi:MAG TPA: VanZ family protein [Albitalea sp.]